MKVERWAGMVEQDAAPGCVWFHLTVVDRNNAKNGVLFDAKPDATEAELLAIASSKWREIEAKKFPAEAK